MKLTFSTKEYVDGFIVCNEQTKEMIESRFLPGAVAITRDRLIEALKKCPTSVEYAPGKIYDAHALILDALDRELFGEYNEKADN